MGRKRNLTTPIADTQTATPTQDAGGSHAVIDWVMAGLLLGAASLVVWYFEISWNFDFESPEFNPAVFLPIFLGAYGFYHFILALRGTLRRRKFGSSTLHVREAVVRMGGPLNGVIRTAVELHPTSDYEIRLQCIETFKMPRGSGETSRNVDRIRWEASTKVGCGSVNSKDGIPFEFTLPSPFEKTASSEPGFMASAVAAISIPGLQGVFAHNRSPDATRWIVTIDAPLQGLNYHAIFGVIVKDSTRAGSTEIGVEW